MAIEAGERPKLLRLGKCELWRGGIAGLVSDGYVVYFGAAVRGIVLGAFQFFHVHGCCGADEVRRSIEEHKRTWLAEHRKG